MYRDVCVHVRILRHGNVTCTCTVRTCTCLTPIHVEWIVYIYRVHTCTHLTTYCRVLAFLFLPGVLFVLENRHWCSIFWPGATKSLFEKEGMLCVVCFAALQAKRALCRCALMCDRWHPISEEFSSNSFSISTRNAFAVLSWTSWSEMCIICHSVTACTCIYMLWHLDY